MDAELAESVIDDAFEALGTPDCRYQPPGSGPAVLGIRLLRHRRAGERSRGGLMLGRGGLETTDRPQSIIVRASEVPQPLAQGVLTMPLKGGGERNFIIGEDPVEDDIHGLSWRCSVEVIE